MSNKPRHFDPLKNKLPRNWTNSHATKYYNRCWWRKCKCEMVINKGPMCAQADKWDPCGNCQSKWTKGCNPCSDIHKTNQNYVNTYNRKQCGCTEIDPNLKCLCQCSKTGYTNCTCKTTTTTNNCGKTVTTTSNNCSCQTACACNVCMAKNNCSSCSSCLSCSEEDVVIKYVSNNAEIACRDLVELRVPTGGSKERYIVKHLSREFLDNNRFQCAIPASYNNCVGNLIDNRKEEEFTESDQRALVSRNVRNIILAERFVNREGPGGRHKHSIPSSAVQSGAYYHLGGVGNRQGSTQTGLYGPHITGKPYFAQCANC